MKFKFKPCSMEDIYILMEEYIKTLSSPFDSFLEDHITASKFYLITEDSNEIGYFAVYEGELLTQFYVRFKYLGEAQASFDCVLKEFHIKSAYVPTCDELFLSLVMDQHITIEKQAYFFQENKEFKLDAKLYENGVFKAAGRDDIPEIKMVSKDFFENLEEQVEKNEIFVFKEDDILLGAGIIERGRVLKGYTSIGMFTNELYRQKGIGRSIILYLKKLCHEKNEIPICGCWYYNTNSKKTLESAGFVTKTRLLNIKFIKKNELIKTVQCKDLAISIRQETPEDYDEVYKLVKVSFATQNHTEEPDYLNDVRKRDAFIPELSLVAQLESGQIIGQITLYKTNISCGDQNITQLVLSPICVLPDYFRRGIGSAMIEESLIIAKRLGYGAVFLWGNPHFYSRFGFVPAYRYNIRHVQFQQKEVDFIMAKELRDGALRGIEGTIDIY